MEVADITYAHIPLATPQWLATLTCKGDWEMSTICVPRPHRKLVWWTCISLLPSLKNRLHLSNLCISCAYTPQKISKSLMNFTNCKGIELLSHVPNIETYHPLLWLFKEWAIILWLHYSLWVWELCQTVHFFVCVFLLEYSLHTMLC